MKKLIQSFKRRFCKHSFGPGKVNETVRNEAEFKPAKILVPGLNVEIDVLKREYPVIQTCEKCGFELISTGYDSLPIDEESESAGIQTATAEIQPEKLTRFRCKKLRRK